VTYQTVAGMLSDDPVMARRTPWQTIRGLLDGIQGTAGGVVRSPYATAKGIDDIVDLVKGQDMDNDTVFPRALKFFDDAANVITPDSAAGQFADEFIGQTIGPGGVIGLASRQARKLPIAAAVAQANVAPIAGQIVEDMGGDATERLMAEIAIGGAPTNFGSHRNRVDVTLGREGVEDKEALKALDEAEGIYQDTGGANYGHGNLDKRKQDKLREEVRRDTGAFVGPDGLPRLEIFDDFYDPNYNVLDDLKTDDDFVMLREVPGMDRIIDVAPGLSRVVIRREGGVGGTYDRDRKEISIGGDLGFLVPGNTERVNSILGHELQHAIQDVTKLPRGGNYSLGSLYSPANLGRFASAVRDGNYVVGNTRINMVGGETIIDPDAGDNRLFLGMLHDMTKHYDRGNQHKRYLNIAGEGEARQAQARLAMSPEQRVMKKPGYPINPTLSSRAQNPMGMTVRLDDLEETMGITLPRYLVGGPNAPRMAPVPDDRLTRKNRLSFTPSLTDEASVTLGFLYDMGLIE